MRTEKQQLKNRDPLMEESKDEQRPMTRVELHGKKYKKRKQDNSEDEKDKKKKKSLSVPFVLLVIILILPITVSLVAKGAKTKSDPDHTSGERVLVDSNHGLAGVAATVEQPKDDEAKAESPKDEKNSPSGKTEQVKEEQQAAKPVQTEPEQTKPEKSESDESQSQQEQEAGNTVYHTVQPGETLYRIAMNYYQSKDGVETIRAANGLNGNDIHVGQKLVIPK